MTLRLNHAQSVSSWSVDEHPSTIASCRGHHHGGPDRARRACADSRAGRTSAGTRSVPHRLRPRHPAAAQGTLLRVPRSHQADERLSSRPAQPGAGRRGPAQHHSRQQRFQPARPPRHQSRVRHADAAGGRALGRRDRHSQAVDRRGCPLARCARKREAVAAREPPRDARRRTDSILALRCRAPGSTGGRRPSSTNPALEGPRR